MYKFSYTFTTCKHLFYGSTSVLFLNFQRYMRSSIKLRFNALNSTGNVPLLLFVCSSLYAMNQSLAVYT